MNCNSIGEQVAQALSTLPEWNCLEEFVTSFQVLWLKLGQTLQQQLVQQKIEETEAHYQGAKTKRRKRYYTPLGEMVVWRRVYPSADGYQVKVDLQLGLPSEKWLAPVLELACALGVSSEFPNAHKLFQQWTCIEFWTLDKEVITSRLPSANTRFNSLVFLCSQLENAALALFNQNCQVGFHFLCRNINQVSC